MSASKSPRSRRLLCVLPVLVLAACGGGGGGDGGVDPVPQPPAGMPETATAQFVSSAEAATALARDVEQRTRDLQLASGLANASTPKAPAAADRPAAVVLQARVPGTKQALAVQSITSELCSQGTASVDVADALLDRFAANPAATLQTGDSLSFTASNCLVRGAVELGNDVALGSFGVGDTVSGSFRLDVEVRDSTQLLLRLTYTAFRWQPAGQAAYDPLDAVVRFGTQGGQPVFALDLPDRRFLDTPQVLAQTDGSRVVSGRLRTTVPSTAGNGYGDYQFSAWRYSPGTNRATAGTVTVLGQGGQQATVVPTATGYSVQITAGGSTLTYAVSR